MANATGCSSIYGGNLPTTPWRANADGRGPAWSNSLFEDNAEFGLGLRLAVDARRNHARRLLRSLSTDVGDVLAAALLDEPQENEAQIEERRGQVEELRRKLSGLARPEARALAEAADYLVRKSVWIVGGDGWAYDIGYGGLDHVLASGRDVNVLVMDTEVYSNTGGQVKGHADRRGRQVRGHRQGGSQEGPRAPGDDLRARVRGARGDGGEGQANRRRVSRGGELARSLAHHRVQPLHRSRLRHGARRRSAAVGRGLRCLAALSVRSAAAWRRESHRSSSIRGRARPRSAWSTTCVTRGASAWSSSRNPKRFARLARSAQEQAEQRLSYYRQLAGIRLPVPGEAE